MGKMIVDGVEIDDGQPEEIGSFFDDLAGVLPVSTEEVIPTETAVEDQIPNSNENLEIVEVAEPVITTAVEEVQVDDKDSLILQLRAELLALASGQQVQPTKVETFPTVPVPDATVAVTPTVPTAAVNDPMAALAKLTEDGNYLTADELDAVIDKPELINKAIHKGVLNMLQGINTIIPQLVSEQVAYKIMVNNAVTEFYQKHEDLRQYNEFVSLVMTQNEAKMKGEPYQKIFDQTAEDCRKRLGLSTQAQAGNTTPQKPAFAGTKKGTSTRPATGDKQWFDENAAGMFNIPR